MKILITLTSYDHKVDVVTLHSVVMNAIKLVEAGHTVVELDVSGVCYLPLTRNACVEIFMRSNADKMIFVDSDVGFDDRAMLNLVNSGKLICGGAYPYKNDSGYPINIYTEKDGVPLYDKEKGVIPALMVPTGLMCIDRIVFTRLLNSGKIKTTKKGEKIYFDTGFLFSNDEWHGEDVAFCKICKEEGIEIWLYPDINFIHVGRREVKGNYFEYLKSQPKPETGDGSNKQSVKGE